MLAALALALLPVAQQTPAPELREGIWRAWLDSPGGELPFQLELRREKRQLTATIHNGEERVPFPVVEFEADALTLAMPHYDSKITAVLAGSGERLDGEWVKRGSGESWTRMAFHATYCLDRSVPATWFEYHGECRFRPVDRVWGSDHSGRWRVDFESSEEPAVAIFGGEGVLEFTGTFLTTLGDYRYLAGDNLNNAIRLSCFDGAHAFLFKAYMKAGQLQGDFWSRDTWHETWTAVPDPEAALPDAFELTRWNEEVPLASLTFPDLDGVERSLGDPAFAGKARIVQLFGTWCPNCNDEASYLAELDRRFGERGLSIVGLAFEHTGDFQRDAEQVRRYRAHHGIDYPILLAGTSDKAEASKRFPLVDRVRAYPTTLFLDAAGRVRAIHTGFAGPATGKEHEKLRMDFERTIETLLGGAASSENADR